MGCANGKFLTLSPSLRSIGRGGGCTVSVARGAPAADWVDQLKERNEGTAEARFELLEPPLPIEESEEDDGEDSSEGDRATAGDEAGDAVAGGSNDDGSADTTGHASTVAVGDTSRRMTGPSQVSEDSRSPP